MKEEHKTTCITRLLTIITVLICVQTLSMSVIIYGVYTAYDRHRGDLMAIGNVPWAAMANDLREGYATLDKNTIQTIITNSHNLTQKANILIHTRADSLVENFHTMSVKGIQNMDIVDIVRKMVYTLQSPVKEINDLLDNDSTGDLKETIKLAKDISEKIDEMKLNDLINTMISLGQKMVKELKPEMLQEITSIVHKVDMLINKKNNKLVHDLAEEADHTVHAVNRLFELFKPINKK